LVRTRTSSAHYILQFLDVEAFADTLEYDFECVYILATPTSISFRRRHALRTVARGMGDPRGNAPAHAIDQFLMESTDVSRRPSSTKKALISFLDTCANQPANLPEVALLISVAGLHVSAGMMASSRPGIGHEPKSGLWGADEGAKLYAVRGPVEHQ